MRQDPIRKRNHDVFAVVALFAIVVIAVAFRWHYDNWLSDFDILTMFLPWFGFVGDRLRELEIPAWNRHDSLGAPIAGNPSGGWMYIPVMIFFPLLNIVTAYKAMVLVQALIAAGAIYAFCRRLGLFPVAALAGGVTFAIGPALYSSTVYLPVVGQTMPFIALGILSAEMAIRAGKRSALFSWAALCGVAVSQIAVAWPGQGLLYGVMYIGGWMAYRLLIAPLPEIGTRTTHLWRTLIIGIVTTFVSLGFAAAAILPQIEFVGRSTVQGSDYSDVIGGDYVAFTWPLRDLFQNQLRDVFIMRPYATSAAIVMLAIAAVVLGRRRSGIPFFVVVALLFIDLASTFSLTRWAFNLVPFFENIHGHRPTGSIAVLSLALSMLAAAGLQGLIQAKPGRTWILVLPVPLVLLFVNTVQPANIEIGWWQVSIAIVTAIIMTLRLGRLPRVFKRLSVHSARFAGLALIVSLILYPTAADFARTIQDPHAAPEWENLITRDDTVESIVERTMARNDPDGAGDALKLAQFSETPFRFATYLGFDSPDDENYLPSSELRMNQYVVATLANARATRLGLEQVSGYNPVHNIYVSEYIAVMNGASQDYHWLDLFAPAFDNSPLLDMLNVRFVIIPANLPDAPPIAYAGDEVFRNDYVIVYHNPNAFERAWIVHDVQPNNHGEGLAQLADGSVDGHVTAFVDGPVPTLTGLPVGAQPGTAIVDDRSEEMIKVRTSSSVDGLLVISQAYAAGWTAYIDGEKVDILRTNHALQGVTLPAGEHTVELRYEPRTLQVGLWITSFSGIAMIGIWSWNLIDRLREKRWPAQRQ